MICNIELPFFPGFYETDLENSDTAYWAIKEELQYFQEECNTPCPELTEDDLDFNYSDYEKDVREQWADGWKDNAPEIVLSVQNITMWSPRQYNFNHDRLYADVELADNWMDEMRHFIGLNYDWLKERIHEDWTSYDGFCSFMSNDVDEWPSYLFEEQDDRYISTMLGYMMYRENDNIYNNLVEYALEDIYAGSYVFLTDEGEEKLAAVEEAAKRKIESMKGQLEIPFVYDD